MNAVLNTQLHFVEQDNYKLTSTILFHRNPRQHCMAFLYNVPERMEGKGVYYVSQQKLGFNEFQLTCSCVLHESAWQVQHVTMSICICGLEITFGEKGSRQLSIFVQLFHSLHHSDHPSYRKFTFGSCFARCYGLCLYSM